MWRDGAVLSRFLGRAIIGQVGLAAQFTAFVAALVVALTALLVVLHNLDVQRTGRQLVERRLDHLIATTHNVAENATSRSIDEQIALVLRQLQLDPLVAERAYAPVGDGRFESHTPDIGKLLRQATDKNTTLAREIDGVLRVAVPVREHGLTVGLIHFGIVTDALMNAQARDMSRNVLLVVAFLAVALPLTAVFMTHITAPVRQLIAALRGFGNAEVDIGAASRRCDEIGELARAFGELRERLADSAETAERLVTTDALTGLPNRDALRKRITAALEEHSRFALFVVNIDRLGRLNIDLGSDSGDKIIRATAARLSETLQDFQPMIDRAPLALAPGADRFLARFGSDEFAILICGSEVDEEAAEIAAQIGAAFQAPLDIEGRPVAVTVSTGIAIGPKDGQDVSALQRSAHLALHDARSQGAGNFCFARSDLGARADKRLAIEQELRQALARNELIVYYQPQVDLRDGAFIGAEALVRWQHPVRGLVGPMEFIDIAEEAGLIDQLGTHVLTVVGHQIAAWAEKGLFPKVAVNVSASQCMRPDFCSAVFEILSASGAPTTSLQIELTETVAMRDPTRTARDLAPLRAAGVRMAIDDFGTGYSNLASITRLPFDVLKIDRSFVSECARDGASRVVVATILTMAQNLGYHTVAEGVETEAQREFLLRYGCTFAQGYLFGKPMPVEEFEQAFVEHRRADARNLQEQVRSVL
jgi:predicted signal transduction protein with EAL and GGDEF domain